MHQEIVGILENNEGEVSTLLPPCLSSGSFPVSVLTFSSLDQSIRDKY